MKTLILKTCKNCYTEKELKDFYSHPDYKDGHMNICKDCTKEATIRNRQNKPAKPIAWFIFD